MVDFVGKVALVTGGAEGIGKAICKRFLEEKIKVCVCDINVEKGEETLKEFREQYGGKNVIFEKVDVADEDQFESAVVRAKKHFGGQLDILINNAGILDEIDWKRMAHVNMFGVANGIELAHRHLSNSKGEKGGTVINTSSVLGVIPSPYLPCYSATKSAIITLTLNWGHETNVKRTNVKVNAICPDAVETNIPLLLAEPSHGDVLLTSREKMKLAGEILQPSDIADGVVKILREDVTRAVLIVSRQKTKGSYYYPYSTVDILFESGKI